MSLAISIPPIYTEDASVLRFMLRDVAPNTRSSSELAFEASELVQEHERVDVWRGTLTPGRDGPSAQVVCKFAYGRRALRRQKHEAHVYFNKLRHLQGKYVPYIYGHFIGNSGKGSTSCLVLEFCGEPLTRMSEFADPTFSDAVIDAVNAIHEAGVEHLDLDARNILSHNGRPVIIDFEEAHDHVCERGLPMIRGAIEPSTDDFNCPELYELCLDFKFWKPSYIIYATTYHDIELAKDARKLAEKAPPTWPRDFALRKAYHAIIKHAKLWYPEQYEAWLARIDSHGTSTTSASENGPLMAAALGMSVRD